jgi:predicted transcriptional regulator
MRSSTTLKLPEQLKSRVARQAAAAGKTAHAFMVEAIESQTALHERQRECFQSALSAREEVGQCGLVLDGNEVLSYVRARLAGHAAKRPRKRKL